MGTRETEDTREAWSTESTRQGSWGLREAEAAMVEPAWVYTTSSAYVLWCLAYCSGQTPVSERWGMPLTLFLNPFLRPFSYYGIASPSLDVMVCAWSYCILWVPGSLLFFWVIKGSGRNLGEEGLGRCREGKLWFGCIIWKKKKINFFKEKMQTFLCGPQQNLLLLSSKFYVLFW